MRVCLDSDPLKKVQKYATFIFLFSDYFFGQNTSKFDTNTHKNIYYLKLIKFRPQPSLDFFFYKMPWKNEMKDLTSENSSSKETSSSSNVNTNFDTPSPFDDSYENSEKINFLIQKWQTIPKNLFQFEKFCFLTMFLFSMNVIKTKPIKLLPINSGSNSS